MSEARQKSPTGPTGLQRPTKEPAQFALFEMPPSWGEHWWGMPEFSMGDATPACRIVINFLTLDDVRRFAEMTKLKVTPRSDSTWFPQHALDEPKEWEYVED